MQVIAFPLASTPDWLWSAAGHVSPAWKHCPVLLSGWQLAVVAEVCGDAVAGVVVWAISDEAGGLGGAAGWDVAAAVVFRAAVGVGLLLAALVPWAAILAVGEALPLGVPFPPWATTLMMISSRMKTPATIAASFPLPSRPAGGRRYCC